MTQTPLPAESSAPQGGGSTATFVPAKFNTTEPPPPYDSPPVGSAVVVPAPAVEPGYTTTEFWGALISSAITLGTTAAADFGVHSFTSAQVTDLNAIAMLALTLIWAVYAIVRTWRKNSATP